MLQAVISSDDAAMLLKKASTSFDVVISCSLLHAGGMCERIEPCRPCHLMLSFVVLYLLHAGMCERTMYMQSE